MDSIEKSEVPKMSLVGSDVVALFPSITAAKSARIVREEIQRSKLKFEGIDHEKALTYIAINRELIENIEELEEFIPKRKSKNGTTPSMASIHKKWDPNDQWEFSNKELTEDQERLLVGVVAEIAIIVLFNNFSYKFGGKFFHQQSGGPIGVRATGAIAQLVMERWARDYKAILENSGIVISEMGGYVDDGRQITSIFQPGMRFREDTKKFEFCPEGEKEDIRKAKEGETDNQRMARVCKTAMNSINEDLVFTTETQEDFEKERLPTLDFEMWIEDNKIKHSYYQKPMRTPFVIMERSGISKNQKFQILSNELNRRLSNIQLEEIPHSEILLTVEQFIAELKNSEYSRKQAREIVSSGLRGWKNKLRKRKRTNTPIYRLAQQTVTERMKKKLTEKESWYKTDKDNNEDEDDTNPAKYSRTNSGRRITRSGGKKMFKKSSQDGEISKIKSVIFIPHTPNSELSKLLKEKEIELEKVTGDKLKIVEKSGTKIEDILTKTDPWKGSDCRRENCFLCNTKIITGKDLKKDCTKRNILYEIRCLSCEKEELDKIEELCGDDIKKKKQMESEMIVPRYIGESGRSAFERGFEHLDQLATLNKKSHMLKHMLFQHENEDFSKVQWGMFILEYKKSAFERQISEAVTIEKVAKSSKILNSRSEWNQCQLPRLITRMGNQESEIRELEKELLEEKKIEEELENRIRKLRKERNKARLRNENTNARKKQKTSETNYISIREVWTCTKPRKSKVCRNRNRQRYHRKPIKKNQNK